ARQAGAGAHLLRAAPEQARLRGAGRRDPARLGRALGLNNGSDRARWVGNARGERPAASSRACHRSGASAPPGLLLLAAVGPMPPRRRFHRAGAAAPAEPRHVRTRARVDRGATRPGGEVSGRAGADDLRRRGTEAAADDRRATRVPRARARAGAVAALIPEARAARMESVRLRREMQARKRVVRQNSAYARQQLRTAEEALSRVQARRDERLPSPWSTLR